MDLSLGQVLAAIVGIGLIVLGGVGLLAGGATRIKDNAEMRRSGGIVLAGVAIFVMVILV